MVPIPQYKSHTVSCPVSPAYSNARLYSFSVWMGFTTGGKLALHRFDPQSLSLHDGRYVAEKGAEGEWDSIGVEGQCVLKRQGVYFQWYSSWTNGYAAGLLTAQSMDGQWKKAADNPKYVGIRAYLNLPVILAYGLFFGCMLLNVVALRTLELTIASVLEASSYIYVMVLSWLFLNEKITRRLLLGNLIIIVGIVLTLTL